MSSTNLVIRPAPQREVPAVALDASQRRMVELAGESHLIFRGAPGSGKTTTLLAIIAALRNTEQRFVVLAPDRRRAQLLNDTVRMLIDDIPRPAKTPAGFAYGVVDMWRNFRADPLGGLELITGAQEDAQISAALTDLQPEQLAVFLGSDGQPSAMLRMELRNLMSTAQRLRVSPDKLRELGQNYNCNEWIGAAAVFNALENSPERHVRWRGSMQVTHAHIETIAADLLETWDDVAADEQLTIPSPIPDVVVVDDLQDMTPATIALLNTMARCGTRIIAASEPDTSVATFRGALPQADILLARMLDVEIVEIDTTHRAKDTLRPLVSRLSGHITNVGPGRRRQHTQPTTHTAQTHTPKTHPPHHDDTPHTPTTEPAVKLLVAQTHAQMGAQIARLLRENHLFRGIPWDEQAIIVRSQTHIHDIQRQLKRFNIPINTATQAFQFMAEPATRTLLRLLNGARLDSTDDTDTLALELISSALVGIDPVDLHRVLRIYGTILYHEGTLPGGESATIDTLLTRFAPTHTTRQHPTHHEHTQKPENDTHPALAADLNAHPNLRHHKDTITKIVDAARIWEAARTSVTLRPREALWNVWEAARVATQWQQRAVTNTYDAPWYDTQLDAIVALFRVADIWEQRHPAGNAQDFVEHTITQAIPVDTLAQTAHRPAAVHVLTPTQAAGQEWAHVIIAGAHDGNWPNTALRHNMLHADVLSDIVISALIGADEQNWTELADPRRRRHNIRDDEYRLFLAGISRAKNELSFAVVVNEDSAPSELIERTLGTHTHDPISAEIPRDNDGRIRYDIQPAPSPLDETGLIGDLRYWASAPTDTPSTTRENAQEILGMLIREGIQGAHPHYWQTPGKLTSDQPILQGIKPSISPSAVEKIETCPLRWFATHIGADSRTGNAATRGTFIHALAEEHARNPEVTVTELYQQRWPEYSEGLNAIDKRAEQEKVEACVNGLQAYFDSLPPEHNTSVEVEKYIHVEFDEYTIRGMVDRLEPHGDKWRIIDFKTGKAKTEEEAAADPQLQTYQYALTQLGYTIEGAQLQYVAVGPKRNTPAHTAGQRLQPALSTDELDARGKTLINDVHTMNSAVFEARRNPGCEFCPLRPICPAWNGTEGETK